MTPEMHDQNRKLRLWEPHINAFVELCPNDVSREGPLAGLRVGVKDVIDVADVPTRNGSETCRDAAPAVRDAPVVARLRDAGAQIFGKTVTTEFAFTDPTDCRNPYDQSRSPGGSSSGSGAAVAAGLADIALGTQTAGSLCRPAAYCGCVGLKPTFGVLPTVGVTSLAPSFDTVGIIAGSVARAQQAFDVLGSLVIPRMSDTPEVVISGLWQTRARPDGDTLAGLSGASRALTELGADVTEAPLTADVASIVLAHRTVMNHEAFVAHGAMLTDGRSRFLKPKFLTGLRSGAAVSPDKVEEAKALLIAEKRKFWVGLEGVDVVLTLPVPEGAPLFDDTTGFQDWLTPWTVFGGPLICLPWGLDRLGRPRSVMLAAPPGRDAYLLATAAKLERAAPRLPPPQLPKN
ncbi:amidase [uncultured Roseobacter sp.]|uniref:amidase n=1 Tax=uncultured Roseobacter sp. TaxID=114847 RepID=UPI002604CF78|nr:amidase [uncultured Roseobacter sp.]